MAKRKPDRTLQSPQPEAPPLPSSAADSVSKGDRKAIEFANDATITDEPLFQTPDETIDDAALSLVAPTAKDPPVGERFRTLVSAGETVDDRAVPASPPLTPTLPPAPERPLARTDPAPARSIARTDPPPPPSAPTAKALPKPKKKRRVLRVVLWISGVLLALVVVAGAVLAIFWNPIVHAVIVAVAKRHGVELTFQGFELSRERLVLTDVHLHSSEFADMDVDAKTLTLALGERLAPTDATATDAHVVLSNAPGITIGVRQVDAAIVDDMPAKIRFSHVDLEADSAVALLTLLRIGSTPPYVSNAPAIGELHVTIKAFSPAWPTTIDADASTIALAPNEATLKDLRTTIPVVHLPVDLEEATLHLEEKKVAVTIPEAPYLDLAIDDNASSVHVVMRKVPADLLAKKLNWSRPPGFALSATADIDLPAGKSGDPSGKFTAVLDHYVPPHPRELEGMMFGDATKAKGSFALHGDDAALSEVHVDAGDLHFTGTGTATAKDRGKITLQLDGSIPCNALAVSAVSSHLGLAAAMVTGGLAAEHVTGTVEVKLAVDIEGKKASDPGIHPSAFVRCSLAL